VKPEYVSENGRVRVRVSLSRSAWSAFEAYVKSQYPLSDEAAFEHVFATGIRLCEVFAEAEVRGRAAA